MLSAECCQPANVIQLYIDEGGWLSDERLLFGPVLALSSYQWAVQTIPETEQQ